ncbi:hypothetical protein BJV78DRAFT_1211869 [Lactifluus subvellereus]|nr:hypothetical protein BJV78DRAFT_1211869 [Lactifluus subvellereus]
MGNRWNLHLPSTFLQGSAQHLRRLNLSGIPLSSLSQLLSSATGLIDLHLCVDTVFCLSPLASLLVHLQGMPFLRHLELKLEASYPRHSDSIDPAPFIKMEDIVPLSNLTYFHFFGYRVHLEGVLAGLAAPSLQDLRIILVDHSITLPIPHLSRFIQDEGRPVFAARFKFTRLSLDISLLHSANDPPFRIGVSSSMTSMARISTALSATLATVEDLFLTCSFQPNPITPWLSEGPNPYRDALGQFRNVEILRLRHALVLSVAEFLRHGDGELALDVLPALKEIELDAGGYHELVSESQRASALDSFGPFVAVRQRMGRPVDVFWNTDQVLPE